VGNISESEKASIIIVTYNHRKYIEACISSIEQESESHEIIVVDNFSQDGTCDFVRERFPRVQIIESQENRGYGGGNNLGVKFAKGDYVVVLNPDTIVKKGWLEELIKPLSPQSRIITTPKILTYDGSTINTCGNINHFTGLTFTRGLGENTEAYSKQEYISGFSGCCFAMRKVDFLELGGFDERFFLYNEDSDLSWRSHLKGFRILFVPTSIIMHDYKLRVMPKKLYYLEKGRYLILRKHLSKYDLVFILPSLLLAEILTLGYSTRLGYDGIKNKFSALKDGLTLKIDKEFGNRSDLYSSLCVTIPADQLTFNSMEKAAKLIANELFYWNFGVFR
jgi:GT2 family glycosyltransferase